jgi:hypothetical protein
LKANQPVTAFLAQEFLSKLLKVPLVVISDDGGHMIATCWGSGNIVGKPISSAAVIAGDDVSAQYEAVVLGSPVYMAPVPAPSHVRSHTYHLVHPSSITGTQTCWLNVCACLLLTQFTPFSL